MKTKTVKKFLVWRKSENTNSFGLYQLFVMAKDGEAYKVCANYLNAKEIGKYIYQTIHTNEEGEVVNRSFDTCELVERLTPDAPKDVIAEVFKFELTNI